jgi:acetyl esterase
VDVRIDPELAAVLERLPARSLDIDTARRNHLETSRIVCGAGEPVARADALAIPGPGGDIPARLYVPDAGRAALPLVVYLHGGGWVMGSLESYDAPCRALANRLGGAVLSVGYRLAPEDPFPSAVKDAWAALRWAEEHALELGADPTCLAVAGDSAGGNLAAALAARARDHGGPALRAQLLVYPATDPGADTRSYAEYGEGFGLTADEMRWCWSVYLAGADADDPDAAPARANLAGLPPAVLVLAELDPLRDEGAAYARALERAGSEVHVIEVAGAVHGYWRFLAVSRLARETLDEAAAVLATFLGPS